MVLNRCYYGNQILRKKAVPVEKFDEELEKLVGNMIETMLVADGVGLAAPQIGESIRLIIVDPEPDKNGLTRLVLVNPELEFVGNDKDVKEEGCLSVPGIYANVERYLNVKVKAKDIKGKAVVFDAYGFTARILQHEIDHLDGIMFVDRVNEKDKKKLEKPLKELKKIHAS